MERFSWKDEHKQFIERLPPALQNLGFDERVSRGFRLLGEALTEKTPLAVMRAGSMSQQLYRRADDPSTDDDLAAVYQRAARLQDRLLKPLQLDLKLERQAQKERASRAAMAGRKPFQILEGAIDYICQEISQGER